MIWFWYCANKRAANYRHAMLGMHPTLHKFLMRMVYPI